jgi:hypothetical protein
MLNFKCELREQQPVQRGTFGNLNEGILNGESSGFGGVAEAAGYLGNSELGNAEF